MTPPARGGVAGRGARAAAGEAADHRVLGRGTPSARSQWVAALCSGCVSSVGSRVAPSRSSIAGRGTHRALRRDRGRVRPAQGRRHRHLCKPTVVAAKQATAVIPIVSAVMGDPVGVGLVASLARPGGNVTGLSNQTADLAGKRLELLREVVPGLRRLAVLANVSNPVTEVEMGEVQAAARTLGLDVVTLEIRRAEDIAPAFETLKGRAHALYVLATRSWSPTEFASTPWRSSPDCLRSTIKGNTSKREV